MYFAMYDAMPSLRIRRQYKRVVLLCVWMCCMLACFFSYSYNDCQQYGELKRTYYNYDLNKKVNPHTVKLDIPANHLCQSKHDPYLFIMIPSATDNFEKRAAIRKTWKTYGDNNTLLLDKFGKRVVVTFILGRAPKTNVSEQIRRESDQYSDIVQGDFSDVYHNLLTKMLTGFNWKIEYCPKAKYLVKVDDDSYLDIPNLVRYLEHQDDIYSNPRGPPTPDRIYAWKLHGSRVQRTGKYALTCEEYPFNVFEDYAAGNCYVISSDLVSKLFNLSEFFPNISLEDIHLTGTLRHKLGAQLIHSHDFSLDMAFMKESPCYFHSKNRISKTSVDAETMNSLWSIHLNNTKCSVSYLERFFHFWYLNIYEWFVLNEVIESLFL